MIALDRIPELMMEVADDCARDVQKMDGAPFNGRTVAEAFGNVNAMVAVVARAVGSLAEEMAMRDD